MIIVIFILLLISGAFEGFNQDYLFHFGEIKKKFPNIASNAEAWMRKWKNGDKSQGPKFFGSSTFLAWTQDLYHFTRTVTRGLFAFAFFILGVYNPEINFINLLYVATCYLVWTVGFHITYTFIFK